MSRPWHPIIAHNPPNSRRSIGRHIGRLKACASRPVDVTMRKWLRVLSIAFAVVLGGEAIRAATPDSVPTFEADIRPIFRRTASIATARRTKRKAGLDLRLVRFQVAGGESGPAIVPGDPETSYLLDRLRAGEMPPNGEKVPPKEIETIARWIQAAPKPRDQNPNQSPPAWASRTRNVPGGRFDRSNDRPPRLSDRSRVCERKSMPCSAPRCPKGPHFHVRCRQT